MQNESWNRREFTRALAITGIIAGGLALDQAVHFWGQTLTNVGIWAAFLYWLRGARPDDQLALGICVFYATLGEIVNVPRTAWSAVQGTEGQEAMPRAVKR